MTLDAGPGLGDLDGAFEVERPRLVGLAYRITGSLADAEDVVQDAWFRWQRVGPASVDRPPAWLTTVVSRLALDRLRSAQRVREAYVGPWLPEPVVTSGRDDPAEQAELHDTLALGFLHVLERLGPVERVVFLLADVFGVPFDDIAATVDRSPAACRQIASRARRRVREDRARFRASRDEAWQATAAFVLALGAGDLDALLATLAEDAVLTSDGGPDHRAARRPVVGPDRVARLFTNLWKRVPPGLVFEPVTVNGQPGARLALDDLVVAVFAFEVDRGRVRRIQLVVNPAKLARAGSPVSLV